MRSWGNRWKRMAVNLRFYGLVLVLFLLLAIVSLHILQEELLRNSRQTGSTLAHSYAVDEERNMATFEAMLRIGVARLDRLVEKGGSREEIFRWLSEYFDDIRTITGRQIIDPYAVVDGSVVAANAWDGDSTFDYEGAVWYQAAMEADGEIIYTDAYTDAIYGRYVVTIAVKGGGSNVMAFDIFPENFRVTKNSMNLPEGGSYFLCDRKGTLLYAQTDASADSQELQAYLRGLIQRMEDNSLDREDAYVYDMDGRQRAVYASVAPNGWISIITIPYYTILRDLRNFTIGFAAVFLVFIFFTALISLRNYRLNRQVERNNETVRVLGNSYYAIYRIDYEAGTYEMIKGSEYVKKRLQKSGGYQEFLTVVKAVIEESACQEFMESFSLENIRALAEKNVRDYGGDFQRLFGKEYRWVNVRLLLDDSLSKGEAVLCFREVGEEKKAQFQQLRLLERALDKARENESSQGRFFSAMSHDMRTPLNGIMGLTRLAAENAEDAGRVREYLDKISGAGQQLLGLINDILELSRLEQGKLDLNREAFDLEVWLHNCTEVFQLQAAEQKKEFSLTCELQDSVVFGDPFRLTQIMNNLLSNALKFTEAGDQIRVFLRQADARRFSHYQFVVEDTGRGMSREYLQKIFEPYEREARFGANRVQGTGLGMPIVKSLVSQMDGQISVESRQGEGSTFTVTLPLEAAREQGAQSVEEQEDAVRRPDERILKGKKILLAEDNELNMEIAAEMLSMHGIEVTRAWNGREALEQFSASAPNTFDVILMDMQMPEMDGCAAAQAIRALNREDARRVPILAVTANAFAEDIAATTKAGMDAHISKPIDFDALCLVLEEFLSRDSDH